MIVFRSWFGPWKWPFIWNWGGRSYYGRHCTCVTPRIPLDDKMALLARDNDHNNDGLVTYDEFDYDISENFNKNYDGLLSEGECVERFSCGYGNTEQVAQFICANILRGEAVVNVSSFNVPPFSMEEKLTLNAANNDYNGDGLVKSEDLEYDITNFYDADSK
ncbi:hypothetical protein ACOMHN_064993 [Nucella lapillus]